MNRVARFETMFKVLVMQVIFGASQVWMLGRESERASSWTCVACCIPEVFRSGASYVVQDCYAVKLE